MQNNTIKSVTVYCSSSSELRPEFFVEAKKLGEALAEKKIDLVYGGASIGIMGAVANAVLDNGGHVIGIIPKFLDTVEVAHKELQDLRVVSDMSERKKLLHQEGDAIVVLPGGLGTLDELVEVMTLKQLKVFNKPIYLVNACNYWTPFEKLLKHFIEEKTVAEKESLYQMVDSIDELVAML